MKSRNRNTAFTLLELLVVLAILAVVTALAVRSLDQVAEQQRYEAALRVLEDIREAVLGSPADRAADGTRTVSGFVADMGRLPRTTLAANFAELELSELWANPGSAFDVRAAVVANGVAAADEDLQVVVPGGWRGPYLRLPLGATGLLDGYGNPVTSPVDLSPPNPETTGYARLRDALDMPINAAGQEVRIIRLLGANGRFDPADLGANRDDGLMFGDDQYRAAITAQVEVLDTGSPAAPVAPDASKAITIRVFSPNPVNPAQIRVVRATVVFTTNPVTLTIPALAGLTQGPRVVRAYLHPESLPATSATERRSAVKHLSLRAGVNLLAIPIDR